MDNCYLYTGGFPQVHFGITPLEVLLLSRRPVGWVGEIVVCGFQQEENS